MEILTATEVSALQKTRDKLKVIQKRVEKVGWGNNNTQSFELGRLTETIDTAENAVLNVLNVAASYCDDPRARRALK